MTIVHFALPMLLLVAYAVATGPSALVGGTFGACPNTPFEVENWVTQMPYCSSRGYRMERGAKICVPFQSGGLQGADE